MINKTNDEEVPKEEVPSEAGYVDVAIVDVQCHIMIKDKDTGEVLVHKRG